MGPAFTHMALYIATYIIYYNITVFNPYYSCMRHITCYWHIIQSCEINI